MDKKIMGGGAIVVGILIALTTFQGWSDNLQYLWAALVLIWGIIAFTGK